MSKVFENLLDKRFGKLVVISLEFTKEYKSGNKVNYWKCLCDCGNTTVVPGLRLKNGEKHSCKHCFQKQKEPYKFFQDLVGQRFGKLTVIGVSYEKNYRHYWECICDCGNTRVVEGSYLKTKKDTISCGCSNKIHSPFPKEKTLENSTINSLPRIGHKASNIKNPGEATFSKLYGSYVRGSRRRKIDFNLSREEFALLIKQKCFYCGKEPSQIIHSKFNNGDCVYNGLDRVDNSKGYEVNNVVPCCGTCNRAKLTMSIEEFLNWIKQVYANRENMIKRVSLSVLS